MIDRRYSVLPDPAAVAAATTDRFVAAARSSVVERGNFRVALSGGSTPRLVYPLLASAPHRDEVDWRRVDFFWGDERAVPPDHPESNFGVAYQMLLAQLPDVRPQRIHRMPAEAPDIDAAAVAYEAELRLTFGARGATPPSFDLIWLGMGADGHVASLFPGSPALNEAARWVVADRPPGLDAWRMSFSLPLINAAREVIIVVTGADKADAVRAVREGADLPAGRVAAESVEWIIDVAAAGEAE